MFVKTVLKKVYKFGEFSQKQLIIFAYFGLSVSCA